jgi:5-methylcytosine-specific restriction protein A
LLAKVAKGKEESSVRSFALGASKRGADHFLFVQPDGNALVLAGLVPTEVLGDIWASQRKKSQDLLLAGSLGKRRGNNAENGHSPTLWLKDELAPEVASIVWQHEEVLDLLALPSVNTFVGSSDRTGDSFDDIVIFDYDLVGSDEPERIQGLRSEVKRDPRVRKAVLERSGGKCERQTCGAFRAYKGFLDVHHVLGAGTSDRVCNCVALCPNCHREAHISPENAELNLELLAIAEKSAQRSKLKNASLRSR